MFKVNKEKSPVKTGLFFEQVLSDLCPIPLYTTRQQIKSSLP
ncbi:hypothetical protein [uncultured Gammaproteobacteria bacterium]|nr:hypothetical protein [uncultured Gammaproteobacteria bacterium]CAC9609342.1 hypothetical protein [uncultured Gammaproteobacteria bacterium]CAC9610171.1 hypothetical protein [uncultured Gammaproteobacteria bacterium]CAC9965631.1 hypothetical protein [uncultured Gammaproteobacteria bacterium]CAC9969270.1 hypothetical protein [uncultured Gammaproteobacteria bacterium]